MYVHIQREYGFWIMVAELAGIILGGMLSLAELVARKRAAAPNLDVQAAQIERLYRGGILTEETYESAKKRLLPK